MPMGLGLNAYDHASMVVQPSRSYLVFGLIEERLSEHYQGPMGFFWGG
jgi:hypothetical protein